MHGQRGLWCDHASGNALTGSGEFWSGAGITGVSVEGGGTSCRDSMKGVECCWANAGAVVGVFACMNHSTGGYAWTSSGSCKIGSEVAWSWGRTLRHIVRRWHKRRGALPCRCMHHGDWV